MKPYVTCPFRGFCCTITMMALLWFTLGSSFVHNHLPKNFDPQSVSKDQSNRHDDAAAPIANTTEEKAETNSNDFASEYLRIDAEQLLHADITIVYNKYHPAGVFVNFCCDSVSPPPETSIC